MIRMNEKLSLQDSGQTRWRLINKVLFRFEFCFFILDVVCGGNASLLSLIPWIGQKADAAVRYPIDLLAQWLGVNVFGLTGQAAALHIQAGSDAALRWVTLAILLVLSSLLTLAWSFLDRRRDHYAGLLGWFRLILRLALGVALLRYGFIKVFPIQFPLPPLAVLNEPVGNSSPTMLFWTLYGLHPGFQMALGWIEVLAGLLLLFRRSAFGGAVLALLVMANVALLDLAFDVPVKLYSLSLVAMALALLIPEARQFWKLFSSKQLLVAEVYWSPELPQRMGSVLLLGCELLVALLACWQFATGTRSVWQMKSAAMHSPAPITGGWAIEEHAPGLVGGDGSPLTSIYFDPDTDTYLRAADGSLWRSRAIYDRTQHRLRVLYEVVGMWMFNVEQPDADHLILTPVGPTAAQLPALHMTRIPLAKDYPLLQQRFHWVDEFGGLR
jgi:hypothetical protein